MIFKSIGYKRTPASILQKRVGSSFSHKKGQVGKKGSYYKKGGITYFYRY